MDALNFELWFSQLYKLAEVCKIKPLIFEDALLRQQRGFEFCPYKLPSFFEKTASYPIKQIRLLLKRIFYLGAKCIENLFSF